MNHKVSKVKPYVVALLLIIILFQPIPVLSSNIKNNDPIPVKYWIVKADDYGDNYQLGGKNLGKVGWDHFLKYLENHNVKADIGVISNYNNYSITVKETDRLKELIAKGLISVFNHGFDHVAGEFANRSISTMASHIASWDNLMAIRGIPITKILGAVGNNIGNQSNVYEPVYAAMALNYYHMLFFSQVSGVPNNTSDGSAGLGLKYCPVEIAKENKIIPQEMKSCMINSDAEATFTQIHPVYQDGKLWSTYNLNKLYLAGKETGRTLINIDDYYKIWEKDHPNYFLNYPNRFLQNINISRSDIDIVDLPSYSDPSPFNNYLINSIFWNVITICNILSSIYVVEKLKLSKLLRKMKEFVMKLPVLNSHKLRLIKQH